MIRTRFAPSPTGFLHIGGARTALFSYLYAKAKGGKFILRIEDTDTVRSTDKSTNAIIRDLKWLGMNWDEGPEIGGNFGPYKQSERLEIYDKYLKILIQKGLAYPTFDNATNSKDELKSVITEATEEEFKEKTANGIRPAWRFRMPNEGIVEFEDLVHGKMSFDKILLEDIIIVRSDGTPTYNFACVIDDALMNITDIIRGDDHLSNTPRQICIYEALGFNIPRFAHIPMILGPDGERLSKRHGATSVGQFKDEGYLSEALVNHLCLLSWSIDGKTTKFPISKAIELFDLKDVKKSAAIFDFEKLSWLNNEYVKELPDIVFSLYILKYLNNKGIVSRESFNDSDWFISICSNFKNKFNGLNNLENELSFLFNDFTDYEQLKFDKTLLLKINFKDNMDIFFKQFANLDFDFDTYKRESKLTGVNIKNLTMSMRLALCFTDRTIVDLFVALKSFEDRIGKEQVIEKLRNNYLKIISSSEF